MMLLTKIYLFMISLAFTFTPENAYAYIGPGTGLTAIGAFIALVAGVIIIIFGFVWYPVKRILRSRRARHENDGDGSGE